MSEHDHVADLDDFLSRRSRWSRVWREAVDGQRAPEALDAAILAAAASAAPRPTPVSVPRLHRWRLPIGLAASLLVGIGVLREGLRDDQVREQALSAVAAERGVSAAAAQRRAAEAAAPGAPILPPAPVPTIDAPGAALEGRPERMPPQLVEMVPADVPMAPEVRPRARRRSAAVAAPPSAAEPRSGPRAARDAEPPASAPATAMAMAPIPAPAETIAAAAAPAPVASSLPRPADAWQPARYRGLLLGQATVDELLHRHPLPELDTATRASEALPPDGRMAHRLLDYGRELDPRGRVRLYVDANSAVLASVDLVLDPPLTLAAVQVMEGLVGDGRPGGADAAPCRLPPSLPGESGEQSVRPQVRSWPGQGVQLLLAGPDRVVEIRYFERCW